MKIKEETKQEISRIVNLSGFHSKVAQTVLTSGKISFKQQEILNQVSIFFIDQDDFQIETSDIKHSQSFEDMQNKSRFNQSIGLRN